MYGCVCVMLSLYLKVYQAGVRNLDLTFIFKNVAWPVITSLSLAITLPYVTFMGLVPLTGLCLFTVCVYVCALLYDSHAQ